MICIAMVSIIFKKSRVHNFKIKRDQLLEEFSGKNDIVVYGKKILGNAFYFIQF